MSAHFVAVDCRPLIRPLFQIRYAVGTNASAHLLAVFFVEIRGDDDVTARLGVLARRPVVHRRSVQLPIRMYDTADASLPPHLPELLHRTGA